ncbi:hypothetical protein PXH78_26930 [Mycolicibacterium smegmatis]|uniref:hypothetical protein n=1 Tax=Mycolicibacterium smegmatis TaxID=1772 RepID=UPI0005DA1987|nr:hypothetical protein [Mycolicibacterium smegmatis]MDF1902747.1 hypothetical protein [Mycolicibacterium smegmatis]MDF1909023.1 hypothetical protein [Mycolicibacterium smegmatis]MDF1921242.1 hypothetical protein [Mycolicibacterium smegmatis]MDF1927507.1 hypothetical protein [Mycolicibacterium smegmatis]UAK53364.1 hypothetical protein K8P01_22490 [Mycolicibacterium smegmatis]
MADEATVDTPNAENAETRSDSEVLGEGGKKALEAERRRANAAEKSLKELQQRLDAMEAEKLSKEERAVKERDEALKEVEALRAQAIRYRVASKFKISDEDADLFLTGTDEETLTRQAQRLAERETATDGLFVPGEGRQPSAPALNSDDLEVSLKAKLGIQ